MLKGKQMSKQNTERNNQIIKLRNSNPTKYSFAVIGEMFKLKKQTVHNIYVRGTEKAKKEESQPKDRGAVIKRIFKKGSTIKRSFKQ